MITGELRGGNRPNLDQALGWIGSRVDDIYGANVGRLEDVWIDPGTGAPRWLLIKEGRFGGRTTLVPFEDATAGAGHVWIPYERELVRDAPEVEPGTPLTQQLETDLRSHFAGAGAGRSQGSSQSEGSAQEQRPAPASRGPEAPIPDSAAGLFTGERPGGEVRTSAPTPAATSAAYQSPDPRIEAPSPPAYPAPRADPPAGAPRYAVRPPAPQQPMQRAAQLPQYDQERPSHGRGERQPTSSGEAWQGGRATADAGPWPQAPAEPARPHPPMPPVGYPPQPRSYIPQAPSTQVDYRHQQPSAAYQQPPQQQFAPRSQPSPYPPPSGPPPEQSSPDEQRSPDQGSTLPTIEGIEGTYEVELELGDLKIKGELRGLRVRRTD